MNIRRFTAPDMRTAIRRVRQEFGPDAVILKSEKCEDGVRIVCGLDFDEAQLDRPEPQHVRQQRETARPQVKPLAERSRGKVPEPAPAAAPSGAAQAPRPTRAVESDREQLLAMRRELRSLRGLLRSELATLTQTNLEQNQPLRANILRRFGHMGMDSTLIRRLTEGVATMRDPADAWRVTLAALVNAMPRAEYDLLNRGGRFAFYGPAGVGKTTSVVRLASQFAARYGRQSVGLISADNRRPGAQTEMLRLGQKLGVYTLAVSSVAETREAVDLLADRRLVLIDTAAMTPRDAQLTEQVALMRSLPQVRPWLVLSATTQGSALLDGVRALEPLQPAACVLTRLDECVALGEALSVLIQCGLPVAFASCGPAREEDLVAVDPDWLVRRMVRLWKAWRRGRQYQAQQSRGVGEEELVSVPVGRPTQRSYLDG